MIKKILVPLILITLSFITYLMVTETIESNKHFLGKLKEYDNNPFLNSPLRNLAPEEIKKLTAEYKIDLTQLDSLKSSAIALVSFCGILVIAIIVFKPDFSVKKFDGLTVMAAYTLLICATFTLFKIFIDGRFEDGHNATIGIRASIEIILMIITPLIFFTTFGQAPTTSFEFRKFIFELVISSIPKCQNNRCLVVEVRFSTNRTCFSTPVSQP
jgi:hypothetical protein